MSDNDNFSSDVVSEQEYVNPETLEFRRACEDPKEAHEIFKRLEEENKNRNAKAANIMQKFNDEPPYNQKELERNNQGWRNNVSTGFLGSTVSRMIPAFKDVIDQARYLTSSRFEDNYPDGNKKSETFQKMITKLIRAWDDFDTFNYRLVLEDILFGYSGAAWTDEYDWHPIFCRQDETLFPDGVLQSVSQIPFWVKRQNFQQHELANYLVDEDASEDAGWNIDNLVKCINEAQPEQRRSTLYSKVRKLEDTIRETTMGRSFSKGIKVVEAAHLFTKEASGKISHYLFDTNSGRELMTRLDRFEGMEKVLALLSIEVGNDGRLHGSKGAGRRLYNTHVALDLATNNFSDNCYLSGLLLLKASNRAKPIVALEVAHPIAVIPEEYEVINQQIPVDSEIFLTLFQHKQMLADMQIGLFMPGTQVNQNKEETASKTNYLASVEMQIRATILRRFFLQYSKIITQIQQRICSPDNIAVAAKQYKQEQVTGLPRLSMKMFEFLKRIGKQMTGVAIVSDDKYEDKDSIECILQMLREGLSPEEVFDLSLKPSNELTENRIEDPDALAAVGAQWAGDPSFNKNNYMQDSIASRLGNAAADRYIIPNQDNTLKAEGARLQLMELTTLTSGTVVPLSPRDDDMTHMTTIQGKTQDYFQKLMGAPVQQGLQIAEIILEHYAQHLQAAKGKGANDMGLAPFKQWYMQIATMLEKAKSTVMQTPFQRPHLPTDVIPAPHHGHPHHPKPESATADQASQLQHMPQAENNTDDIMPLSKGAIDLTPNINQQLDKH